MAEAKWYTRPINLLLALVLTLSVGAVLLMATPARAQTYPAEGAWVQSDVDPNEPGTQNYRDVIASYYYHDSNHLYLRLQTVANAQITNVNSRFKWLFDTGVGSNLHFSGQILLGAEAMLFVEDRNNDGTGEVYLLHSYGDDRFTAYEPLTYLSMVYPPDGRVTNTAIAGYRLSGSYVDMYVSFSALGIADPTHLSLAWATDNEDPNLEQGPLLDSIDIHDTPIHLDADLEVIKDVSNHTPAENDIITYTITVTNTGPATATNILIEDIVPTGVTYVLGSITGGDSNNDSGPPTLTWTINTLANGASATLSFEATVDDDTAGDTITNTATVDADQPDPHLDDNSDSADILVDQQPPINVADLAITKTACGCIPKIGDTITYTVTVTNSGPSTATNVVVADSLPGGVSYQSYSASQGTYNNSTGIWSVGTLADGASATLTITATVDPCPCGSTIINTAIVSADQTDPHPDDNSDPAEIFPYRTAARGVSAFPSLYASLAAALAAGILAYFVRRKVVAG